MSGYVYNFGNELMLMQGLVDIVCLLLLGMEIFVMFDVFCVNENGGVLLLFVVYSDCNGYWKWLVGLELQVQLDGGINILFGL